MNDLVGIKQKYGTKLAICGGFDGNGRVAEPDCTEEEVRAYVKQRLDTLAFWWCSNTLPCYGIMLHNRRGEMAERTKALAC